MRTIVLLLVACALAPAQTPAPLPSVVDDPALPRVLIIGDSISIGYTDPVRKLLAGKANVHRNPLNAGPSSNGVFMMDSWLKKGDRWDVIHFNFGLHDLKRMSDGEPQVALPQYERNLRLFVKRLKETGAKLVFATTTPVPEGASPPRVPADVAQYNAAALRVMRENGIPVNDLNSAAQAHGSEWQLPANVHYRKEGSEGLAVKVAEAILAQTRR